MSDEAEGCGSLFDPCREGRPRGALRGRSLAVLMIVGLIHAQCSPDAPGPSREASAGEMQQLLDVSGADRSISSWPEMATAVSERYRGQLPTAAQNAIDARLPQAYEPTAAKEIVVQELGANFDAGAAEATKWWFLSELGSEVGRRELAAGTPAGGRLMEMYSQLLRSNPASQERIEAAVRYDRATRKSAALAETLFEMTRALRLAVNDLAPIDQRLSVEQIDEQLAPFESQTLEMFQGFTTTQLLYIQKDFSSEQRAEIVRFAESGAAQWFYRTYMKGLGRALANGTERLRHALAEPRVPRGE